MTITDIAMNPCQKCGLVLHYPSQLHTVFTGHTCCYCLGHAYGECFKPRKHKENTNEYNTHICHGIIFTECNCEIKGRAKEEVLKHCCKEGCDNHNEYWDKQYADNA